MTGEDHDCAEQVTAPLTQLAMGLPVETEICPTCGRTLRAGTPVNVALTRPDTRWHVRTIHCQQCPPPHSPQSTHLLAATLSQCSHVHTQTHTLCLADLEQHTAETLTTP